MKRALLASAVVAGTTMIPSGAVPRAGAVPGAKAPCHVVTVPVGDAADRLDVVGDMCRPRDGRHRETLLVTVSGATYGRVYWDVPYQPSTYSFVQSMTTAGFSVLNIDRLGIGDSSHPSSVTVDVGRGAAAVHDVVVAARAGVLDGHRYERVVLVSHSLGTGIATTAAARHGDVDGVIATGLVHNLNEAHVAAAAATFYPATLDPRFAGRDLDPGYQTTLPGTRGGSFYYLPNTDPAVLAIDEATKETVTWGEMSTFGPLITPGIVGQTPLCDVGAATCAAAPDLFLGATPEVDVPVLMVVGSEDSLMCGGVGTDCSSAESLAAAEAGHWGAAPCFRAEVVPAAGHNINLHRNARDWYETARSWLEALERTANDSCP